MRVLIVNTVPTERNGITNVIFNLIRHMPMEELEFGYVSISDIPPFYFNLLHAQRIRSYVISRNFWNPISYILNLRKIAVKYDVIHVHGNSATMVLEMTAAYMAGVKLRIAHSHNTICSFRIVDKLMRPIFYRLCNGRLACGQEAGRWLFKDRKFQVLNNGINPEVFKFDPIKRKTIRQKLGCVNNLIIGNVGNFVEQKNHVFLLEIFAKILIMNHDAKLLLLGDGPLLKKIQEETIKYNLSNNVIFVGSVDNPADYLSAMDLIVMPSIFEGLPLTLIEEQANGLDCIVSNTISKNADMTGNLKFLSLNDSTSKWAEEIKTIFSDQIVPRNQKSILAIQNISNNNYDIHKTTEILKEFYFTQLNNTNMSDHF